MFVNQFHALAALLLVATIAQADQPTAAGHATTIDFTIGGVGIDSTLEELHEKLPTAVPGHAPNAIPMQDDHLVVINNGANQVPTGYFRFWVKP